MKTNYVHHITQPLAVFIYTMKDCNLRLHRSPLKSNQNNKHYNYSYYCLEMKKVSPPIKRMSLKNMNAKQENSRNYQFSNYISPRFLVFLLGCSKLNEIPKILFLFGLLLLISTCDRYLKKVLISLKCLSLVFLCNKCGHPKVLIALLLLNTVC